MKWINSTNRLGVKILLAGLHALLMLGMAFAWNNSEYSFELESALLRKLSLIKKSKPVDQLQQNKYISRDDVLFVNTGQTGKLVPLDEDGNNTWITDRKKLAEFLSFLNRNPVRDQLVICDLVFEVPDENDTLLRSTIDPANNLYFPSNTTKEGAPAILQHLPGGYTDYNVSSKWWKLSPAVNKLRLMKAGSEKSLALLIAGKYLNTDFQSKYLLLKSGNKYYFNTVFLDHEISTYDLKDETINNNTIYSLADLLAVRKLSGDTALIEYTRKPFIMIGDFDKDLHEISGGTAPGALIQFNAIMAVINQQNRISMVWGLFIFAGFFFISFITFFVGPPLWAEKLHLFLSNLIGKAGDNLITNIFWLYIISISSYFIFTVTIEVIGLVIWLSFVKFLAGAFRRYKEPETAAMKLRPGIVYVIFDYLQKKKK